MEPMLEDPASEDGARYLMEAAEMECTVCGMPSFR
jgi:hypothetical protein